MRRLLLIALAITLSATAVSANRYSDCKQTRNVDRQIRGCTQIIERGRREPRQNRFGAHFSRASAYLGRGELDRAIADFNAAIAIKPRYRLAYVGRGDAHDRKGDHDRAIADFNKAIALEPNQSLSYVSRGLAYLKKGEYDRGIGDLTKALKLNPKSFDAYHFRGVAYGNKHEYDRTIADLTKALGINPKSSKSTSNVALHTARSTNSIVLSLTTQRRLP